MLGFLVVCAAAMCYTSAERPAADGVGVEIKEHRMHSNASSLPCASNKHCCAWKNTGADAGPKANYLCVADAETQCTTTSTREKWLADYLRQACGEPEAPPAATMKKMQDRLKQKHAKVGRIQVSLIWDSDDDLDLHVALPNGEDIWFMNKKAHEGELDVDCNAYDEELTTEPVENIFFKEAQLKGKYDVAVECYQHRNNGPVSWTLSVTVDGQKATEEGYACKAGIDLPSATSSKGKKMTVYSFTYS